jgi:hypothetical protein
MIKGQEFVYLELQKTGSSHVRNVLLAYYGDKLVLTPRHRPFFKLEKDGIELSSIRVLSTIRNPWDWYVSLWSFGRMGKGGFYKRLTGRSDRTSKFSLDVKYFDIFENLYSHTDEIWAFKKWLNILLHDEGFHPGENYNQNALSSFVGFYTYRLIRCCCSSFNDHGREVSKREVLPDYMHDHLQVASWLRMENLNNEILQNANLFGMEWEKVESILRDLPSRSNASNRRSYSEYYDDESKRWVAEMDHWIIHTFGYTY